MTKIIPCTVQHAVSGRCGKPGWYFEMLQGLDAAECFEHAHEPGSLYLTRSMKFGGSDLVPGVFVELDAYGRRTVGEVTWVGTKNARILIYVKSRGERKEITRPIRDLKVTTI